MENKYLGITVNERLYLAGLIDEYYEAVKAKNKVKMIFILHRIELDEESIIDNLKLNNLFLESDRPYSKLDAK